MTQVVNDTRKETCFRGAEQKSQQIKSRRRSNKHRCCRDGAPTDHDSGDPTRRTDAVENKITRDFEYAVAEEEYAGTEPESGRTEPEIGVHLQTGKPDVHPVQPRYDVQDEQKRDQPQCDFAQSY